MNNSFFVQLLQRLFSNNPKFFKTIQIFAAVLVAVSSLLSLLGSQDISLPAWTEVIDNVTVKISGIVAIIIAQLPNKSPNQQS